MKTMIGAYALTLVLVLGTSGAVLAAEAPAARKAAQTLAEGCKQNGGTWTAHGRQGGSCTLTAETAAKKKKKKTLEQWCKDHGGTWTSDGHQGGSCAL